MAASTEESSPVQTGLEAELLVLDTNVVLACMVFRDPRVAPLTAALKSGRAVWVACPRMREELRRTLSYPALARWNADSEHILTWFDSLSSQTSDPPQPQTSALLCSDPDDQVFIELALARQADWLLTRDRALLKLKARAARRQLRIATPETWVAWQQGQAGA